MLDASRSVGVVGQLLDPARRDGFLEGVRGEYAELRERHAARGERTTLLSLEEARRRKVHGDWEAYEPPRPGEPGGARFDPVPLEELVPWIDWTPFFQAWELRGAKYPDILDDPAMGTEARKLLDDARRLLDRIVEEELLTAQAVVGLFPASSEGDDDVVVWADEARTERSGHPPLPAPAVRQAGAAPTRAWPTSWRRWSSGREDWIGAFAVTAGHGSEALARRFQEKHDDYSAILAKALADRLAEALAERMHAARAARSCGATPPAEELDNDALIAERYRGIRPAPGLPGVPRPHREAHPLPPAGRREPGAGITPHRELRHGAGGGGERVVPAHPARLLLRRRPHRRATRWRTTRPARGWTVEEVERWLAPSLGYEPAGSPA